MDLPNQRVGSKDARLKSKGCLACIRMKVKCDQAKPNCERCRRARRQCPGYRDQSATIFRYENNCGPVHSGAAAAGSSSSRETAQAAALAIRTPPAPLPTTEWRQYAVAHFFSNFTSPSRGSFAGYFELLPQVYTENLHVLHFRNALEAVALASFARVQNMGDQHLRNARQAYVAALGQLGPALRNPELAASVTALATVDLLWKYDIVMGEDNFGVRSPHRQGQLEVLRMRLARQLDGHSSMNRNVLGQVRMHAIGRPSSGGKSIPPDDLRLTGSPAVVMTPSLKLLSTLLPRVGVVCGRVNDTLGSGAGSPGIDELLSNLHQLNDELQQWEEGVPEGWRYKLVPKPNAAHEALPPHLDTLIVVPNMHLRSTWFSYWIARVDVLRCIAMAAPSAVRAGEVIGALLETHSQLLEIADTVCACVPHTLGHITDDGQFRPEGTGKIIAAFFLTRVLYLASKVPGLPALRKDWLVGRLEYIGHHRGIGQALVLSRESSNVRPTIDI